MLCINTRDCISDRVKSMDIASDSMMMLHYYGTVTRELYYYGATRTAPNGWCTSIHPWLPSISTNNNHFTRMCLRMTTIVYIIAKQISSFPIFVSNLWTINLRGEMSDISHSQDCFLKILKSVHQWFNQTFCTVAPCSTLNNTSQ